MLSKDHILFTLHREENTRNLSKLKFILTSVNSIGLDKTVLFPCHPKTRSIIENSID